MGKSYKPITSMKKYQSSLENYADSICAINRQKSFTVSPIKKLLELASDAGAIYRIDGTVLINKDIFDTYLERFHEPATGKGREEMMDER